MRAFRTLTGARESHLASSSRGFTPAPFFILGARISFWRRCDPRRVPCCGWRFPRSGKCLKRVFSAIAAHDPHGGVDDDDGSHQRLLSSLRHGYGACFLLLRDASRYDDESDFVRFRRPIPQRSDAVDSGSLETTTTTAPSQPVDAILSLFTPPLGRQFPSGPLLPRRSKSCQFRHARPAPLRHGHTVSNARWRRHRSIDLRQQAPKRDRWSIVSTAKCPPISRFAATTTATANRLAVRVD